MEKVGKYNYQRGFGNHFCSEAVPDTLPKWQNSPQQCPKGLYAEQISGTAFTVPRAGNQRSWLYRIKPSVCHKPYTLAEKNSHLTSTFGQFIPDPSQFRWKPFPIPEKPTDFVEGMFTICGAGDPATKTGVAIHIYACNKSMKDKSYYNSDGDFLIIPQEGTLDIQTEFGFLEVSPLEVCVIQRGIQFSVAVSGNARGYICEVYTGHFKIPDLGPIGANGCANPRDFLTPVAAFEDRDCAYTVINKFSGQLYQYEKDHSPFNIVAWHGNYAPYKYDLRNFNAMNTVTFDHPDPSIFTVLTCPAGEPGVAAIDFVVFPPRWAVGEHTFRPPWFHRNLMSEYMGLISGMYEAKSEGFVPGGGSLHSCMSAHGPDTETFNKASTQELKPQRVQEGAYAFMLESTYIFSVTDWAKKENALDLDYWKCWQDLPNGFRKQNH